jgi:hypothetical protein
VIGAPKRHACGGRASLEMTARVVDRFVRNLTTPSDVVGER